MTTYTLYTNGVIKADGFPLTVDELNPEYQAYQAWLQAGNVPISKPASDYLSQQENYKLDRAQLRSEFQTTVSQLQNIEAATNLSNAQIIAAVKFLARTHRLLLKLLARTI